VANDDFLVPAPRPFIEASIEIAEQPAPRRGLGHLGLERLPQPAQRADHGRHPLRHPLVPARHHLGGGVAGHLLADMETSAGFALAASYGGYSTNLPLEDLTEGKAWMAFRYDGQELEPEHGGPARLLVPHLYLWKSAKWIRRIQLLDQDEPGFWESVGYHSYGDPWQEQRYWGD
jgi:hypothetical protein